MIGKRFPLYIGLLLATVVLVPACAPEEETPTPGDDRDKLVDAWSCNETSSQTGSSTYTVLISKSTTASTEVLVENFYAIGNQYKAAMRVSGSALTLPSQIYNGNQLTGGGSMSGNNSFSMTYYIDNGSSTDTCTATFTRQ